jgi:lipoate-protein ligase A
MLEFEELVLRHTNDNFLLINYGAAQDRGATQTSIVMGMSGKANLMLNTDKVINENIQVLRRYTGGGTVVVDHSTVFITLIMNSFHAECQPYPREIMTWTEDMIYGPAFKNLLTSSSSSSSSAVEPEWSFKLRENDYIFQQNGGLRSDKKIGGNAQTITKDRWVHHTSFLWDFDPLNMDYLQIPAKRPAYRRDRPHTDFITNLSDKIESVQGFEQEIIEQTSKHFTEVNRLKSERPTQRDL